MRVGVVTGTVGVGKSTIGFAVAELTAERGTPAAFLDLDQVSRLWPAPEGDPFRTELLLTNLASVVDNYDAAGAELLVLAWVLEDDDEVGDIERATRRPVEVVRLVASPTTIETRLRARHRGPEASGLDWHLRRAPELVSIQDAGLDVETVDADRPVDVVAADVADRWG